MSGTVLTFDSGVAEVIPIGAGVDLVNGYDFFLNRSYATFWIDPAAQVNVVIEYKIGAMVKQDAFVVNLGVATVFRVSDHAESITVNVNGVAGPTTADWQFGHSYEI